ncbi:MAG: ARMT1-like domain-containing protein [Anaerolineae bacterium]|nr:ARMT1-like domain-containing protein [Anaerolineae bacterium]
MRTYLDCYPCFLRQALDAARHAQVDEAMQRHVLLQVMEIFPTFDLQTSPPEIGAYIHRLIRLELDNPDPYRGTKERSTAEALALYPRLKKRIASSANRLDTAVRLAIAGNIIDLGVSQTYDLWDVVERMLTQEFAIDSRTAFRTALSAARSVLYLADNAGETVFDRLLIETLELPVTYVVKGSPVLNDATLEDARAAGLDQVATLLTNGADIPGTILAKTSAEFQERYAEAELIIAKGQGNYETLSGSCNPKLFYLLQVKCPVIARDLGVQVGAMILKQAERVSE